ncbi:YaiO family outer membrane beta-barrel protein [bacterium SCSIO 12741]|nr:YaiO family outer membrane beta-barrel protein [bacterium SCSIO 12741]
MKGNRVNMVRKIITILVFAAIAMGGYAQESRDPDQWIKEIRETAFANHFDSAITECDSLLTVYPEHFDTRILLTRVLAWDGQLERAQKEGRKVYDEQPENYDVIRLWSTVLRWSGKPGKAQDVSTDGLVHFPQDKGIWLDYAMATYENDEYLAALDTVGAEIHTYPDYVPAVKYRLRLLIWEDSLDYALQQCDSMHELQPEDLDYRVFRSDIYARQEIYKQASDELDTVIRTDSNKLDAWHLMVNVLLWDQQPDSALTVAQKGLERFPRDKNLHTQLAKSYLYTDSFQLAVDTATAIIEEDSLDYDAWNIALNAWLALENYDTIIDVSDYVMHHFTGDEEVERIIALAYAGKKKYNPAKEVLAKDDEEAENLEVSSKVLYAKLHYWNKENSKALKLVESFLESHPESVDLYLLKTQLHISRFEKKKAFESIDSVAVRDTNNPNIPALTEKAENIFLNNLGAYYSFDYYDNSEFHRHALTIEYLRRIQRHVILGRLTMADRAGATGYQFEIDAYPVLTDWMYLYLNAGVSNGVLFPDFRAAIEPYVRLPLTLELSAGLRYMNYPTEEVLIYTGSIGAYPGNFYFAFRPFISVKDSGVFQSYNVKARYFFPESNLTYLELNAGTGSSPDNAYLDPAFTQFVESRSYNIGLTFQKKLGRQFYGRAWFIYDHYQPEEIPNFTIYSSNIGIWWMF